MATPVASLKKPTLAYFWCIATLVAALALPISLAVFNPTLMFERGWEQFAGTGLYLVALGLLAVHVRRFWREEAGLARADARLRTLFQPQPAIRPAVIATPSNSGGPAKNPWVISSEQGG